MAVPKPYTRLVWRGRQFDYITKAGVEHLEYILGRQVLLMQGPFSSAVGASAGTHAGSGAIDIDDMAGISSSELQRAGREAGWAFWHRPTIPGLWGSHFHGIQIGNSQVSDDARRQVQDYYAGLNGLASHAREGTWRPNPIVRFNYPMRTVSLDTVRTQARRRRPSPKVSVRIVQRTLNLKTGTNLVADGVFGPVTRKAYGRFERQVGGDGDGIPARFSLRLLGHARYQVED